MEDSTAELFVDDTIPECTPSVSSGYSTASAAKKAGFKADKLPGDTSQKLSEGRVFPSKRPAFTYEVVVWVVFLVFTALAVADRFTTNVWPRQTFSINGGSAGNDRLEGYKPGPWSVVTYDVLARISGRFCICCFNLLLVTRLKSLEHFMSASWVGKYLLDCSDIVNGNIRLHRWNAIALCVLTLVHVWSILLPCVTHQWDAQIVPGTFEYPLSERSPPGFKDANPETETMSLQVDDVWRLVEMTILLGIFTPLSVRWLSTHWHIGMPLHRFVMVMYFVDIVRRHTHPHSWVLNTPIFVIWILDKILWVQFWRRSVSPPIHRILLGDSYMVLLWKHGDGVDPVNTVGPDYSLRLNDSSLLEDAHIFTTFQNRGPMELETSPTTFDWTVGTVIRVFDRKRYPPMGRKDKTSHTLRLRETPDLKLTARGPYQGEMSEHIRDALWGLKTKTKKCGSSMVVMIAAGSGLGFILDALQYWVCMNNNSNNNSCKEDSIHDEYLSKVLPDIKILFTTRDEHLFLWARSVVLNMLAGAPDLHKLQILFAFTGERSDEFPANDTMMEEGGDSVLSTVLGRLDLDQELMGMSNATVFCQGGSGLKNRVAALCRVNHTSYYGGLGGGGS